MPAAKLQAPAQSAICTRRGRLVRPQRPTECLICWATPDFPQGLLGGVAERVILAAPLREWRDAARQCAAISSDVHDGPRPAAPATMAMLSNTFARGRAIRRDFGAASHGRCKSALRQIQFNRAFCYWRCDRAIQFRLGLHKGYDVHKVVIALCRPTPCRWSGHAEGQCFGAGSLGFSFRRHFLLT
jgi:hypothetical protein